MIEIGLGGLVLAAITFVAGRLFVQSENIILKKREVYEEYLDKCITAHDAYKQNPNNEIDLEHIAPKGDFFLYASQEVIILVGRHIDSLGDAFSKIDDQTAPLDPTFQKSITKYNAVLKAMRYDVLGWSIHGIYERIFGDRRARNLLNEPKK
ncbi:MAG: hypothetical protein ACI84R_002482 [Candidatus Azotimanducaceae bacterium]|jgi:hypothetical protein